MDGSSETGTRASARGARPRGGMGRNPGQQGTLETSDWAVHGGIQASPEAKAGKLEANPDNLVKQYQKILEGRAGHGDTGL